MYSAEREYAEDAAMVLESMGMPRAYGKLLGYLLVCDPPQQTSAQLTAALELSKGSVSTGTRMLEQSGLIRRVVAPNVRGRVYEMMPDAIIQAARSDHYRNFAALMQRGVALLGDAGSARAQRVRRSRDFFDFFDREIPKLIARFETEYPEDHDG